jgi:hypothetical protein
MKNIEPIGVETRRQCPDCGGEVERRWYGKLSPGQEPYMVWVCKNPGCEHYNNNCQVIRPKVFIICPKCHQETAHCAGQDIGSGNDFWDRYYLYCEHCGALEYVTKSGGQKDSMSEQSTDCPYCGVGVYSHDSPTTELLKKFEQVGAIHNSGLDFSVFVKDRSMIATGLCPHCCQNIVLEMSKKHENEVFNLIDVEASKTAKGKSAEALYKHLCPHCHEPIIIYPIWLENYVTGIRKEDSSIENATIKNHICPRCGEKGSVGTYDAASTDDDYYDGYIFTCPKCRFRTFRILDGGSSYEGREATHDPFV